MKRIGEFTFRWKYLIVVVVGVIALFVVGRSGKARADTKDKVLTGEQEHALYAMQNDLYSLDRGDLIRRGGKLFLVEHRMQHNTHSMLMACLECRPKDFDPDTYAEEFPEVIKQDASSHEKEMKQFLLQKK